MDRRVVVLSGPPGAGKTTAAHQSGLEVYDRDDPHWPDEATFRTGIASLATNPTARAVVIRSASSSSARAKACTLVGATHLYLLTADRPELARRVARRDRADKRNGLAAIAKWFDRFDDTDDVQLFPGWHLVPDQPNVQPKPPPPPRATRTGRRWRRTVAMILRRDHGICHLCGQPGADTADHLVPVSKGGPIYDPRNLAAAHHNVWPNCNRIRGDRAIQEACADITDRRDHEGQPKATWVW